VIGFLLIVTEPPDAGDQRMMKAVFRPRYGFRLIDRAGEDVVGVVLDNIMLDTATTFGMRLDIDVRHQRFSRYLSFERTRSHHEKGPASSCRPGQVEGARPRRATVTRERLSLPHDHRPSKMVQLRTALGTEA
jgi:hypothetical protein